MTDAADIHRSAIVCDMLLPYMYGADPAKYLTLERIRASGTSFVSITTAVDWHTLEEAVHVLARERAHLRAHSDRYVLAESADDIVRAKRDGRLAIAFNVQGTNPLQSDLSLIEVLYRLGVRHMLLTYNQHNTVGGGGYEASDGGLGKFGRMVVREMNRVGMLVDLSHTGHRSCMEAFEVASSPLCFTHSNPQALWDNPRNIGDALIRACAQSGGVVGVTGIGLHMGDNDSSSEMICRQIDHIAGLVGAEHVGIGLSYVHDNVAFMADFNGHTAWAVAPDLASRVSRSLSPAEYAFAAPDQLSELAEVMVRRGYDTEAIHNILGGNWIRVARRIWR